MSLKELRSREDFETVEEYTSYYGFHIIDGNGHEMDEQIQNAYEAERKLKEANLLEQNSNDGK